jgi:hypothetical protein
LARSTRSRLLCVTALVVAVAFAPASLGRVAANSAQFQDATGEDPQGPDITSVAVSNSDEGLITFRINIPNRATLTEDMRVRVWVDSDSNRQTGLTVPNREGLDAFLLWDRDGVQFFRCSGSSCSGGRVQGTLRASYRSGATFGISAYDLKTKRFRFTVEAAAGLRFDPATKTFDVTNARWDYAPAQEQLWSYTVRFGPSRLLVKSFSTTPAQPTAGKTLIARLAATRNDTGAVLSRGRVSCVASIGGKPVKPRSQRFSAGQAVCVYAIPAKARGQRIRGSVTIALEGVKVTKAFSRKIA